MKKAFATAGFVLFSFMLLPTKAIASSFSQFYVFGDSLSDTGNIFNATGGLVSPEPSTVLSTLAIGAIGTAGILKRKRKKLSRIK